MENSEVANRKRDRALDEYPEYDLEYYIDDDESPAAMIICSTDSAGHLAAEWIGCEASFAIPMESIP